MEKSGVLIVLDISPVLAMLEHERCIILLDDSNTFGDIAETQT